MRVMRRKFSHTRVQWSCDRPVPASRDTIRPGGPGPGRGWHAIRNLYRADAPKGVPDERARYGPDNRLAGESSPYLLLHQHNPVDWYPWGEEALEKARCENKPIFLSVGYSTCYWCHVMERESFSDLHIAAQMNRDFVNIKLDREERPDLDEIYMAATQLLTARGAGPTRCSSPTDLAPFFAGTYFPPTACYGRPGFGSILNRFAEAWKSRRAGVDEQSGRSRAPSPLLGRGPRPFPTAGGEVAPRALARSPGDSTRTMGGFGAAPKFPSPSNLYFLSMDDDGDPDAKEMLAPPSTRMARGGIYDQLAGGFHRYSTDREWIVPHFEKMLYDI